MSAPAFLISQTLSRPFHHDQTTTYDRLHCPGRRIKRSFPSCRHRSSERRHADDNARDECGTVQSNFVATALAGNVPQSIPSVRPFCYLSNRLAFDLNTFMFMGHDHSSPQIKTEGHRSTSRRVKYPVPDFLEHQ